MSVTAMCLSLVLYHEARSQTVEEQLAIANVVLNRVESHMYPNDICSVVKSKSKTNCAFSWYCDGESDKMSEPKARIRSQQIAKQVLDDPSILPGIESTHFLSGDASPWWSTHEFFRNDGRIGAFRFFTEMRRW